MNIMLKIIDLNKELIEKAQKLGYEAIHGDYFREGYKQEKPVFMTASNPMWTFGGGLDYLISKHFPNLCEIKQIRGGGNERIANLCFTITVDENLKATKETIKSAIEFALENTSADETLCLSGVGTGIGGLSVDEFLEVLEALIP